MMVDKKLPGGSQAVCDARNGRAPICVCGGPDLTSDDRQIIRVLMGTRRTAVFIRRPSVRDSEPVGGIGIVEVRELLYRGANRLLLTTVRNLVT